MGGATQAFPLGTPKDAQELLNRIQQQLDEFYQERIGGALIGDVFNVPDDEVLTLQLHPTGALQKVSGYLAVLLHPTGALAITSEGIGIYVKSGGALRADATGIYVYPSEIKLDDLGAPDNNTDLNASITKHGLCPKYPNDATKYLDGTGAYTTPPGAGDVVGPAGATDSNIAEWDTATGKLLKDSGITHASLAATISASHARSHAITETSDHTSSATSGQMLKANASGLPVDATNTDIQVSAAVTASHARSHAITGTSDHTSTATPGQMLKADANGLPVDATNTDLQISAAVTATHAAVTVTDTTTVNMTLTGQDVKGDVINYWTSSSSVADDGTVTGPTITANYAGNGRVIVSSGGVINESCEFEIDSTGTVYLIRGSGNIVANADIDGKFCLGTSVANPIIFKNRLGGSRNILISMNYA